MSLNKSSLKIKWIRVFTILLALISITLSTVAICRTFPTNKPVELDYLGVFIMALTLLITVLVGWQIYVVIELKSYSQLLEKAEIRFDEYLEKILGYTYKDYAYMNIAWIKLTNPNDWIKTYVEYIIKSLSYLASSGEYQTCYVLIDDLIANIKENKGFHSEFNENHNIWLLDIMEIENKSHIKNFSKLYDLFEHDIND